ncbi:hypothetical protein ZOSMA_167G00060 [Zostera marina]|uniref:Uncharacterized protein n=1 Tax=Zostera marina TaxID=29655 RepID=A0A0K9PTJ6_ZOSMR|nr:hypothetical protein ZOSMA_167G00060 [Zostera marina]
MRPNLEHYSCYVDLLDEVHSSASGGSARSVDRQVRGTVGRIVCERRIGRVKSYVRD